MPFKLLILVFLTAAIKSKAAMPVIDVKREVEKTVDAIEIAEEAANLGHEIDSSINLIDEINRVEREMNMLEKKINNFNRFGKDVDGLAEFNPKKYKKLAKRLRYLTEYIRKFKRVYGVGKAVVGSVSGIEVKESMETNRLLRDRARREIEKDIEKDEEKLRKAELKFEREEKNRKFWQNQKNYVNKHSRSKFGQNYRGYKLVNENGDKTINSFSSEEENTSWYSCKSILPESWCS